MDDLGRPTLAYPLVGTEIHWRKATVVDHYPMSAGQFQIRAITQLMPSFVPGGDSIASAPIAITVVDDQPWRSAIIHQTIYLLINPSPDSSEATFNAEWAKLRYMPDLELLEWLISRYGYSGLAEKHPDRPRVAKLVRKYLNENSQRDFDNFKSTVHAVLALELAAESPELYARAVTWQDALGPWVATYDQLRAWLLRRYRKLMLDIAKSIVTTHRRNPDSNDDLEDKAEDLINLNVPEFCKRRPFLTEKELRRFMNAAGLEQEFIDEQIKTMREDLRERNQRLKRRPNSFQSN